MTTANSRLPRQARCRAARPISKAFELVAVVSGENLEIYLDRFATNEPVTGAAIEVETPAGSVKATEGAGGTYRVAAPWFAKRERTELLFTVTSENTTDILPLTIPAAAPSQGATQPDAAAHGHFNWTAILLVLGGALAGALLSAMALRGRRSMAALVVVLSLAGARALQAHEGHGHEEEKAKARDQRRLGRARPAPS